mmetsp:Transcript_4108/g.13510  ORF Transcript_4108/g.13510 Transcript_4108/m.13510 type:complete len:236 (-) Transcript_4108:6679-7386(-)
MEDIALADCCGVNFEKISAVLSAVYCIRIAAKADGGFTRRKMSMTLFSSSIIFSASTADCGSKAPTKEPEASKDKFSKIFARSPRLQVAKTLLASSNSICEIASASFFGFMLAMICAARSASMVANTAPAAAARISASACAATLGGTPSKDLAARRVADLDGFTPFAPHLCSLISPDEAALPPSASPLKFTGGGVTAPVATKFSAKSAIFVPILVALKASSNRSDFGFPETNNVA